MLKGFKEFIKNGNVLDLAVAVILGAAFGKIVGSLVEDILMPVIGSIFKVNFADWKYTLQDAVMGADGKEVTPGIYFGIGKFITGRPDFDPVLSIHPGGWLLCFNGMNSFKLQHSH